MEGCDFYIGLSYLRGGLSSVGVINIVDARMGRGKSSAAIRYMNKHKGEKKFLYITPYLDEVDRVCEQCDFDQSENDYSSKSADLKQHIRNGRNVAATHSLFRLMDEETRELVHANHYSLIVDESIQVIERLNITRKDYDLIVGQLTDVDESGALRWRDSEYTGRFSDYKNMAEMGFLYQLDSALLCIMSPALLRSFDEVYMLTYLFDGQYQKAYLEYFGFEYRIIGVRRDAEGYCFSDSPDAPPPADYRHLINIVDDDRLNRPGDGKFALSKNWFSVRAYNDDDIKALRNNMRYFFQSLPDGSANTRLWTSFRNNAAKLTDARTGRFRNNFLQMNARATNKYRDRTDIAYMVNRFIDPNLMKFFARRDIVIDSEQFALSEMLQWIWRSAIRDGKPINLYIPSRRMRELLINWINDNN